ncbi:MAG: hypothetical protein ACKOUU_12140 [Acinetobacter tjernbergiae]
MNVINIVQTERVIDAKAFRHTLGTFTRSMTTMTAQAENGFKPNDHRSYRYFQKGTPYFGQYNWQLKIKQMLLEPFINSIYLRLGYVIAKLIPMFFIFGLSIY